MKAVLATPDLIDAAVADPVPGPEDVLLRVEALAVNPVDTKVRAGIAPGRDGRILGWDAAGVVEACGEAVTLFQPGDAVMVKGSLGSRMGPLVEAIRAAHPRVQKET